MKIIHKREITFERESSVTVKLATTAAERYCTECAKPARMVPVDEAAAITQMTSRNVFRLVETGTLHFQETTQGQLLICLATLTERPILEPKSLSTNTGAK